MKTAKFMRSLLLIFVAIVVMTVTLFVVSCTHKQDDTVAYGKIFKGGVNEVVDSAEKFDTSISNVDLSYSDGEYMLKFVLDKEVFEIPMLMVSAKRNNVNKDHFIGSPLNFQNDRYSILNIRYTTCANIVDLMPANYSSMEGKPVLSIYMKNATGDIYYWQLVLPINRDIIVSEDEKVINAANEYWFIKEKSA